jgi:hypothetical protein
MPRNLVLDTLMPLPNTSSMNTPSHSVTENGKTVTIHGLEVFCAYDPALDGDHDAELKKFDNGRVRDIVESTRRYMEKGSFPRLVVMHEKDGNEPKSSVGRFTSLRYEERDGVGFIVGDCEVERPVFDRLLATNAFPRRSAEIWADQNHLSEVALLGRETPRRPLPDTHFGRTGEPVRFARSLRFDMGTVGGGLSSFVPGTKDTNMAMDYEKEIAAMKCDMDEIKSMMKKHFGEGEAEEKKEEMAADDMLTEQFAEESDEGDGIHIDIDSHGEESEEEEDAMFPASRPGKADTFALRRENATLRRELNAIKSEMRREKFSREIDLMEHEGYRIPAAQRPRLIAELEASSDPVSTVEGWRELFTRDPMGVRIDMSRSSTGGGDIDAKEVASLVREFAGKPEEFKKAINSRIKR